MRQPDKCVYFNGTQHEECQKGILYSIFAEPNGKLIGRLPCLDPKLFCDMRQLPTAQEVESDRLSFEKRLEGLRIALTACREDARTLGYGEGKGGQGEIDCPVCKTGKLHYSVASVNGHLWGACTTIGCMSWMQ